MRLYTSSPNCHVLEYEAFSILFSYNLPVAVYNRVTDRAWRLEPSPSKTTSRHMANFLTGPRTPASPVSQAELDELF